MGSDKIVVAILSLVCPAFPCVCVMCVRNPKHTHIDSAAITGVVDFV